MSDLICVECGKPFQQKYGKRPMKFCTTGCGSRHAKRIAYHRDKTDKFSPTQANCEICGETFLKKRRSGRYCSRKCYEIAWPINNRLAHNARQRKKRANNPQWFAEKEPIYADNRRSNYHSDAPWKWSLHGRRSHAKKKGLPFDLDDDWARQRWTGKCELTGLPFFFGGPKRNGPVPRSITIDRIIPSLGYVKGNCRFILHSINAMRSDGTDADMLEVAKALIRFSTTNAPSHTD